MFNRFGMTAGVADRAMGTGAAIGRGLVRAGMAGHTARGRVTGMVIAVTAIIATAIAGIMTVGGIRSLRSAPVQSSVVRLPLRRHRPRQSIAHRLMVTAIHMYSGAIIVIAHIGPRIILFSRITAPASSVIRHIDS
ncbi:hypothetical protein A4G21_10560 [Brucella intermedia]|uniref:Uncharacterized protein n=1 Tax=Ochrobactrum sp. PW1 TaxID=1882222 RepID=A0A292GIF5_9HYPH|nr:hypothetical protein A4G21_10560 [Brucella intermedia]OAE39984.1 hypothetical protein A7J42_16025 [Brucella intermedia]OOC58113.1 hypothetical protein AS855_07530 [Brucella intermedia M86]BBA73155.1 hypothetical protein [Ochrobactrum sp. PW1]